MTPYQTAKQLCQTHDKSLKTIRTLIDEIRGQVRAGRYPEESILDGCGVYVNVYVFYDYMFRRKALKDSTAARFVPEYDAQVWRDMCVDDAEGGEHGGRKDNGD